MTDLCRDRLLADVWDYIGKCRAEGAAHLDVAAACEITLDESNRAIAELLALRIVRRGTLGRYVVAAVRKPHIARVRGAEVPS